MIDWVNIELNKWQRYYRDNRTPLGYPTCTVESRAKDGAMGNDNKGKPAPDPYVPEDVALMERVVLTLPEELQTVIKEAYMTGGTREDQARRLTDKLERNVSRTRLCEMLDYSHHHIAGIYAGIGLMSSKISKKRC